MAEGAEATTEKRASATAEQTAETAAANLWFAAAVSYLDAILTAGYGQPRRQPARTRTYARRASLWVAVVALLLGMLAVLPAVADSELELLAGHHRGRRRTAVGRRRGERRLERQSSHRHGRQPARRRHAGERHGDRLFVRRPPHPDLACRGDRRGRRPARRRGHRHELEPERRRERPRRQRSGIGRRQLRVRPARRRGRRCRPAGPGHRRGAERGYARHLGGKLPRPERRLRRGPGRGPEARGHHRHRRRTRRHHHHRRHPRREGRPDDPRCAAGHAHPDPDPQRHADPHADAHPDTDSQTDPAAEQQRDPRPTTTYPATTYSAMPTPGTPAPAILARFPGAVFRSSAPTPTPTRSAPTAPTCRTDKHEGDDIFASYGSPVVAVQDGTITGVSTTPIGGNNIHLTTSRGDYFYYAHLSRFATGPRRASEWWPGRRSATWATPAMPRARPAPAFRESTRRRAGGRPHALPRRLARGRPPGGRRPERAGRRRRHTDAGERRPCHGRGHPAGGRQLRRSSGRRGERRPPGGGAPLGLAGAVLLVANTAGALLIKRLHVAAILLP